MAKIDTDSAIPRYHQIAEAIRYDVATGVIRPGAKLPSLKEGAERWGVNMHTVRRAYGELAKRGIVETRTPGGTSVLAGADRSAVPGGSSAALRRFITETARKARDRFGLDADGLAALLTGTGMVEPQPVGVVSVVECSETQCIALALQVERRWHVRAIPWCLDLNGDPPPGIILSTYFHYNDVRRRWPTRFPDLRFVAIRPDPELAEALSVGRGRRECRKVLLCERDRPMADSIAADLRVLLSPRDFRIDVMVSKTPGQALRAARAGTCILFSPRVWGELNPSQRADARAFELPYVFVEAEILAIASGLGWAERHVHPRRGKEVEGRAFL